MTDFQRPPEAVLRGVLRAIAPIRRIVRPMFVGWENIPKERPLLFVGNHTLYGLFDVIFLFAELYEKEDIFLRSLGDHVHFTIPGWAALLRSLGAIDGTRDNAAKLLSAGEPVLVFPGGGRETAKRKGERYKLFWKERVGFARLAIEHGATIVPFSAIGVEEALDVLIDTDEIYASPLGPILRAMKIRRDVVLPLVRGIGPTPIPRPERLYFRIGAPIDTRRFVDRKEDEAAWREVRDEARASVLLGIDELVAIRAADPDRSLAIRLAKAFD